MAGAGNIIEQKGVLPVEKMLREPADELGAELFGAGVKP